MADAIRVTFGNLDEAKQALVALHARVQEVTNDPEFSAINAYWSMGSAKNALHDAFQGLRQCSLGFEELVNKTIVALMQAGVAFQDADGNAVQLINGSLYYPGSDAAIAVGATGAAGDAGIYSEDNRIDSFIGVEPSGVSTDTGIYSDDNKVNTFVRADTETNYTAIAEVVIGRTSWATGSFMDGAPVVVADSSSLIPVVPLPPVFGDFSLSTPIPVIFPQSPFETEQQRMVSHAGA
jgi:hypothetical protein